MTVQYIDPFGPPWHFRFVRLVGFWRGSIWQFLWAELLLAMALCSLVLFMWIALFGGKSIYEITSIVKEFVEDVRYIHSRFQAAMALMLGFYTSTIYGRWWRVRELIGTIVDKINDTTVQIVALIQDNPQNVTMDHAETTGDSAEEIENKAEGKGKRSFRTAKTVDAATVRRNAVRYLNLSHALLVGDLFEKEKNQFTGLESLHECGLLTLQEYDSLDSMSPRNRHAIPLVWLLELTNETMSDTQSYHIGSSLLFNITGNVSGIRGAMADLYMYQNTPMPLAYVQLVNFAVRFYILTVMFVGGLEALYGEQDGSLTVCQCTAALYWFLLPFCFEYFLFVGWLEVSNSLLNPFRHWSNGFDWENHVKAAAVSSNSMVTNVNQSNSTCLDRILTQEQEEGSMSENHFKSLAQWETELGMGVISNSICSNANSQVDDDVELGIKKMASTHPKDRRSGALKLRRFATGF